MSFLNSSVKPGLGSHSNTVMVLKLVPLVLIFMASFIGNIILARFASRGAYRKTGTNMVILSQTIADLGTTCLVIPFAVVAVYKDRWTLGEPLCRLHGFFNMFFTVATLYNLSFLAYDRFLVIVGINHRVLSRNEARTGIVLLWAASFGIAFPWMDLASEQITTEYTPGFYICYLRYYHPFGPLEIFALILVLLIGAAIPSGTITYCFYRIMIVYREHRFRITPVSISNVAKFALEEYCRSVYTSLLMIGTTMIFVLPSCFTLFIEGIQVTSISHSFETASKWIMWCHCTIKPIIYVYRNKKWRRNFGRHLQAFLPNRATLYDNSPPAKTQACMISKNVDVSSGVVQNYFSRKYNNNKNNKDAVQGKFLGILGAKEAWGETTFVDICPKDFKSNSERHLA